MHVCAESWRGDMCVRVCTHLCTYEYARNCARVWRSQKTTATVFFFMTLYSVTARPLIESSFLPFIFTSVPPGLLASQPQWSFCPFASSAIPLCWNHWIMWLQKILCCCWDLYLGCLAGTVSTYPSSCLSTTTPTSGVFVKFFNFRQGFAVTKADAECDLSLSLTPHSCSHRLAPSWSV